MTASRNYRTDSFVAGLAIKAPVKAFTDAEVTLAAEQTVNSVVLVSGDRVLVKDQTDPIENGIYVVETSAWKRAPDFDGNRDIVGGTIVPGYRDSDGRFVHFSVNGDGSSLQPGTDSLTFSTFYDPAASGSGLPLSSQASSVLRGDGATGWVEETDARISAGGSITVDGSLNISDTVDQISMSMNSGALEVFGTGGFTYIDSNVTIRFDEPVFYLETATAQTPFTGYGQFWVRDDTPNVPMFTDDAGNDWQLNTSPSFAAPLVLGDDEEIQFGASTDVTISYDSTLVGLLFDPLAIDLPVLLDKAVMLRLGNQAGSGYVEIQNDGISTANAVVISKMGGTSTISYEVGDWDHNDNKLIAPLIEDYSIRHQTIGSLTGTLAFSLTAGNSAYLALTEDITTVTISDPPASGSLGQIEIEILQDSTARAITWPGSVLWPNGSAPDLSAVNSRHLVHLRTRDGGTTYFGTHTGPYS